MTMSRFSAALRWLCSSPRATTGESPRATVIRQEHSSILMTLSSSGYLYHRQEDHIQGEEVGFIQLDSPRRTLWFQYFRFCVSPCHQARCGGRSGCCQKRAEGRYPHAGVKSGEENPEPRTADHQY